MQKNEMSKTKSVLLKAVAPLASAMALLVAGVAHASGYLIEASDTEPIFTAGATAAKSNGLAILNIAVPYAAGAAVAFAIIGVLWFVVSLFLRHRRG